MPEFCSGDECRHICTAGTYSYGESTSRVGLGFKHAAKLSLSNSSFSPSSDNVILRICRVTKHVAETEAVNAG